MRRMKITENRVDGTPRFIAHGEMRGYVQHIKMGTEVCEACRMAQQEYDAARRSKNNG
ncbi:hypothetical protein PP996_gp73 [Gordonia phage SheckWes]|uniref:Uncharacterized protein n=1 Tax=Gordonia phage SheckWes TaxID=2591117 RepID=A0A515MIL1_9CAUD|nr:hypothetical protein PP996_gp73 [Gordonia phage SheckWes]QDM56499.1 hypothetical protein SEA_SHECKWES_73 [Gordonia phage SheckWes]